MIATELDRAQYRTLRGRGWRAIDAARAIRSTIPPELLDIVGDLMDRDRAEWTAGRYTMRATTEPDYHAETDGYGEWTNDAGPDTVPAESARMRTDYKHFRPEYSIAERIETNRAHGMTAQDARDRAREDARYDMLRAVEADYRALIVTASRAGVELGRSSLGGLELAPDIALPYSIGRHMVALYVAESLGELIAEAIAEADETAPRIARELMP